MTMKLFSKPGLSAMQDPASQMQAATQTIISSDTVRQQPTKPLNHVHAGADVSVPGVNISQLSLHYHKKTVLKDANLTVDGGSIMALVGPSGCGKTSLLSSINRLTDLIPGCYVTGEIRIGKENVLAPKTDVISLRSKVGMVFQRPNPFPMSIYENIAFPLREHGMRDRHQLEETVQTVLEDVGLWSEVKDRLSNSALALSGGQQQRLCIARATALKPEILLFDEPCGALDPISSGTVEDLMASFRSKYTVLVVTHNLAQARRIADNVSVCWVQQGVGCLIESGTTAQIFDAPQNPITEAYVKGIRG